MINLSDVKAKIFVINLQRSVERWNNCEKQLTQIGFPFERIDAIDGRTLTQSDYQQSITNHAKDRYYKTLTEAEVACYLSHQKAWQKIIDDELDFAIVLEDDFIASDMLGAAIRRLAELSGAWDYIKLAQHHRKRKFVAQRTLTDFTLGVFNKLPASTLAQAISRSGATKLLAGERTAKRPIDIELQYGWEKDLISFGLTPCPVDFCPKSESEIDSQSTRNKIRSDRWRQWRNEIRFVWLNRQYRKKLVSALNGLDLDFKNL